MNAALRRKIIYIISFLFLIIGTAIVLHHHDSSPKLAGCKRCKVTFTFTGPQYKAAINSTLAVAVWYAQFKEILPVTTELIGDKPQHIPLYIAPLIFSNKSPPVHLA
jgi:hypothetical protein